MNNREVTTPVAGAAPVTSPVTSPAIAPTYPPGIAPGWAAERRPETTHKKRLVKAIEPIIHYPESDGMPMAENTAQFRSLTKTEENLEILYQDDPNVFVAGDLFWYPVKGRPTIKYAPDVMVAFGRPKGDRGSYKQWEEGNIPPQVVFEIWSPGNRQKEKNKKFAFYDRYGVEEYYTYDPDDGAIEGWLRKDGKLQTISDMEDWISPRLGIRFTLEETSYGFEMQLYYPDGRPFLSNLEQSNARAAAEERADEAMEKADEAMEKARQEADARAEAEAEVERTNALLRAALEQLQKAGLPLSDSDGAEVMDYE